MWLLLILFEYWLDYEDEGTKSTDLTRNTQPITKCHISDIFKTHKELNSLIITDLHDKNL